MYLVYILNYAKSAFMSCFHFGVESEGSYLKWGITFGQIWLERLLLKVVGFAETRI